MEYFNILNDILKNERNMSDEELVFELNQIPKENNILVESNRLNVILKRRMKKYCKKHKIKTIEYDSVLPIRMYLIDILQYAGKTTYPSRIYGEYEWSNKLDKWIKDVEFCKKYNLT